MKRLLVATDFSVPAENAAKYAIGMAKAINAGVTLVNAYSIPLTVPTGEMGIWPVIDYEDIPKNIGGELDQLVKNLLDDSFGAEKVAVCPKVDYSCQEGSVREVINKHYDELGADLIIMGLSGAGGLVNFMLGSSSMAMVEHGKHPVLLVPYGAGFKGIKKIAYAGMLSPEDVEPMKFVCQLASSLDAEVCVMHIIDMREDLNKGLQSAGEDFVDALRILSGYDKVSYQPVWNSDADQGLEWMAEQEDINMVCMLHHRHSLLQMILKGSRTKRLARYTNVPLLIFPPAFNEKIKS